ncbi:MAG: nuclear transport factor 2 family protein [Novosphingobium sp.]
MSYADDRAEIEDLMARYLFALDFFDADTYADTFTQDGVLDWAMGIRRAGLDNPVRAMGAVQ